MKHGPSDILRIKTSPGYILRINTYKYPKKTLYWTYIKFQTDLEQTPLHLIISNS